MSEEQKPGGRNVGLSAGLEARSTEAGRLKELPRDARAWLAKHVCMLCDMPLNKPGCSAIYKQCTEENRTVRLHKCLASRSASGASNAQVNAPLAHGEKHDD